MVQFETGTWFPPKDHSQEVVIRLQHDRIAGENPLAPWIVVGHCTKCGMPYFVNARDVNATSPPNVRRSCSCHHE